jgi:predicted nucleic acid-binding protein
VTDGVFVDRALATGLPLLTSDARLCRAVDGLLSTELLRGV